MCRRARRDEIKNDPPRPLAAFRVGRRRLVRARGRFPKILDVVEPCVDALIAVGKSGELYSPLPLSWFFPQSLFVVVDGTLPSANGDVAPSSPLGTFSFMNGHLPARVLGDDDETGGGGGWRV